MKKSEKKKLAKEKNKKNKNNSMKDMLFKWKLKKLSLDFPEATKKELTVKLLIQKIIPALQNHESVKLLEVTKAHPNHHEVDFADSKNPIGKKWLDQHSEFKGMGYKLFSFHIDGERRLYGYIDGSVFYPIWYDNNHGLYPSPKKFT